MKATEKTREQLLKEVEALRQRNAELESLQTEFIRTEQTLRRERSLLSGVMDTSPVGIITVNIDFSRTIAEKDRETLAKFTILS